MKGKKLSKVLALLLACVMIFTTIPLMAFASNEAVNIYTVSNESPAIPMTVGTQIAVGDLAVTFADGAVAPETHSLGYQQVVAFR